MSYKIGLAQVNSKDNVGQNLKVALDMVDEAVKSNLDLICFPESFLYLGHDNKEKIKIAQGIEGEFVNKFKQKAKELGIFILMGSIYEKVTLNETDGGDIKFYNTSVLINDKGEIAGVYRKIHLCDIYTDALVNVESKHIKAGDQIVVADTKLGKLGLSICYDLRFAAMYGSLRALGAEVMFVPSAFFTQTGKAHWLELLTARAIENQAYIVAPAQWGHHYLDRHSFGKSVVIDPWGGVIAMQSEKIGLLSAEIDLEFLNQVRKSMPVYEHQRNEVYITSK